MITRAAAVVLILVVLAIAFADPGVHALLLSGADLAGQGWANAVDLWHHAQNSAQR